MLTSNIIKRIFLLVIVFIGLFTFKTFAIVSPTSDFYVNDYANLLSSETEKYIINANKSLYAQTGAQIVVVTVPNLEGNSLEEYSTELFRNFGIGSKEKNNGILLLLALEEREFRVEVGYGLEGILSDAKTGRIQDNYIIPYLKQNDWDNGIKNGFSAILQIIVDEYGVDVNIENAVSSTNSAFAPIFAIGIIPMISCYLPILTRKKKKKYALLYVLYFVLITYFLEKVCANTESVIALLVFNLIAFICCLVGYSYNSSSSNSSSNYHHSSSYSSRSYR